MKTLHTIYTSFAKRAAIILTLLLTLGVTSAWAQEEELVYTLDGNIKGGTNNYTTESTITQSTKSWSVKGNTQIQPWRIGGNSLTKVDRAIYSTTAIDDDISKIVITHGTANSITVNSMTVIVSTLENGGGTVISTLTPTFSASGDVTITRPDGKDWSDAFYKIVYNVTVSGSSNKFIEFTSAKFYKTTAPSTFTVTCEVNEETPWGTLSPTDPISGLASGTSISAEGNVLTIGETEITATPNAQDANYTYAFSEWTEIPIGGKVTENITVTANFTRTARALTNYRTSCSTKEDPNLSWSANTCIATMEVDNDFPTLTNSYDLSVNYSSSDPTIATIDENGTITLLKAGTTTITASYDEDEDYLSASVSYNLTVHPSNCRWVETEIGEIEPEDEVLVTMKLNSGDTYTLDHSQGTTARPPVQIIAINGNEATFLSSYHSNSIWNISGNATDGYILYPNGSTTTWLYCTASDYNVKVGKNADNLFTIDGGYLKNKIHNVYVGVYNSSDWRHYPANTGNAIANQTLKFYKKTCLPANKFWIDYELANITCTTNPTPSQIDQTGEDLSLEFSANDGYKLPETISVKTGETEIGNDENYCIWDKEAGALLIAAELITDNITITVEGCERLKTPANLLVTNITSTSATLSWNAVTNADEYRVCVMDGETKLQEFTTTETSVNVSNLKKNSFYTWDVVAEAEDYCESQPTAWIEFTTLDVHTVTFNSDGGTDVAPQNVDHGTKATKPANPTKTGYTFAGWYTEADTEFSFNTLIESATTLYAKWNAKQYTITFRQQWGNGGTETATVHFDNNDFSVSPIIVPTRNGYTFGGYYTAESGAGTQLIDVSGAWLNVPTYIEGGKWVYADDLTLYAKWTQNFTITWMANGQPYHSQTAMMGTAIAKPDDPVANELACDDKVFVGWLDRTISGSTNEEPTFVTDFGTIQANKTYYAVFAKLTGTPSNDYNQITDINDLTDGEYVIAYSYNGGTQVVLKNTTKDDTYMNASALAPSSNKYTSPSAEYIWQLQKQDDGSYYMYNSSVNKFLYATTSALQLSDNPTKYTISYDNTYSHWKIKLSDNASYYMHGYVSGSSYDFRVSTSGSDNKYRVYLYKNASTAVYSDYVTTCVEIPTPHWEGAEIDNANIAVNCGTISYKTNASAITFPTDKNYDLTYPITLTASEGFLLSTNKQNDVYEQSVTVTPVQSDDNKGKITQSVHVRADATGKNTNFDGTITISGDQLTEDQIIEVHAVVDCPQYTLTFNDCGATKTITDFAGTSVEEMEPWAEICSEPVQYVFDGWATEPVNNGTEEYEKVDFSTFTMPAENTTLYAVYRYAEEGGEPVNGYVKVTEALTDWSGDYVIVDDENLFAIKNAYRENTNSNKTLAGETVTIENDKVVSPSANIVWTFSKNGNGYTMYNVAADIYVGIGTHSRAAVLSEIIADENNINIIFDDATDIAKVSGVKNNRCFQYYVTNDDIKEWRTYDSNDSRYNTGYLYRFSEKTIRYTSLLVCGTIEAEDAIVTSTVGQTVKVYVPITLEYSDVASITGTSDNEAFTVVTKNDVAVGESNIEVHYKPTAYVNTANQEETATITLTTSKGATTTFNVTGRCLPEAFVIAAKWGNNWYALPANMSSETTAEGLLIEVDNPTNPAKAIAAPNTTKYSLKAVYKSNQSADRFAEFGNRLVFVEEVEEATPVANKTLYNGGGDAQNSSKTNIQVYAQYSGYYNTTNPNRYEWIPTTTDLKDYTLTSAHVFTDEAARTISLDNHGVFGTLLQNKSYNGMVRLLPVESFYTPTELQVVEWKEDGVSIMYTGSGTKATTKVGNNDEGDVQLLSEKKIDHAVYTLSTSDLIAATNQVLTISIQDNDGNIIGTHKMTVPWILNSSKSSGEIASEVTQATDIVVLNGATLTAANTKHTYDDVVVYPGGKLVIGVDGKLGMYSLTLRLGSSWGVAEYEHKYPEFVLNTNTSQAYTNTSGKINLDYVTTKEQYYTFVAPFEVKTKDIKYPVDIYGSNVAANNRGSFEFQYYDGAARAAGERGWTVVDEDPTNGATLTAHKGYTFYGMPKKVSVNGGTSTRQKFGIHRIPMTVTAANAMTHENSEQLTIAVAPHPSEKNINSGWNLIGNPYMSTITGLDNESILTGTIVWVDNKWEWSDEDTYNQRFIVFPSNDGEWYYTSQASNATLPAFKNFFVQIANGTTLAIPRNTAMAQLLSPARRTAEEIEHDIEMAIVLEKEEAYSDQLDFLINDAYGAGFDYNADFTKMMNATNLNLYGVHMDDNLSFVALDHFTARGSVAIGYQVPAAGEYTLRISDKPYVMLDKIEALYVTDHEMNPAVTTNLMEEDYLFHVGKAEINDTRFTISLTVEANNSGDDITTDMGEVDIHSKQPKKYFYDGELYILRDGKVYSATGHEIQTINE